MDQKLVFAAAHLRRQALEDFKVFVEAFRVFAETRREECIRAPAELISVTQGRAQNCTEILRMLDTCHIEAAKHGK